MAGEGKEEMAVVGGGERAGATCPVCGAGDSVPFWSVRQVPVFANVLCDTEAEARRVPRGDIALSFCSACGYIWNIAFEPSLVEYAPAYENALHFSDRFRQYADELARRLVETHGIRDGHVVEIGCGDGQFLALLCDLGGNRGFGFDPSHDPGRSDSTGRDDIEIIADYYSEAYADRGADLVCCRHVLEHIPAPLPFLEGIRRAVGDREDAILYFEVPNALYTLRDLGIWDILYEHCSYFSPVSLRSLLQRAGFEIVGTRVDYGEQFLCIEAKPGAPGSGPGGEERGELDELRDLVERFGAAYRAKVSEWKDRLTSMAGESRRAAVWGAGTKGVIFLNTLKVSGSVEYIVDINPRKHGRHVAGTGQPIVPPEHLRECPPDTVIVMNAIYIDEIREQVNRLGLTPSFASA
jgi:SAM-dependent methyltransferase